MSGRLSNHLEEIKLDSHFILDTKISFRRFKDLNTKKVNKILKGEIRNYLYNLGEEKAFLTFIIKVRKYKGKY